MFSPFLALHICFVFILHKSSSFLRFKKNMNTLKEKKFYGWFEYAAM